MRPMRATVEHCDYTNGRRHTIVRRVGIIGVGQVAAGEHWDKSLRIMGSEAVLQALRDAQRDEPEALYIGNMLSGQLLRQENVGALIADYAGLRGIEAIKIEAACASGAAAVHMGYLAIASGMYDLVVAGGVEKMTDAPSGETTEALASAADSIYEAEHGLSFVAINALLMRRYMHEYGCQRSDFAEFSVNAHRNAVNNPYAMFRRAITPERYLQSKMIADPIGLYDSSPIADGAAAVVLAPLETALNSGIAAVEVVGSAVGTDSVALHERRQMLTLNAARLSSQRAYVQARVGPNDIDVFELHDAFTIMSALSLEANGFAQPGQGVYLARDHEIGLQGRVPISTMGGLKARGHPVGASGVYQIVEAVEQLRGRAGENQVRGCEVAMAQSIGGSGANVVTHILRRVA